MNLILRSLISVSVFSAVVVTGYFIFGIEKQRGIAITAVTAVIASRFLFVYLREKVDYSTIGDQKRAFIAVGWALIFIVITNTVIGPKLVPVNAILSFAGASLIYFLLKTKYQKAINKDSNKEEKLY